MFSPGEAHLRLLSLPWRDVFTTNWDTLLERAASNIAERGYSVIQDMDQIPLMSQPRIVKLHGSFPSNFPLIVTEEDYRTYPNKYAPFVNTVQQAMMETIFLLVGFSGEDPNFRRWSDWMRDNLGDAAPKIYLAGWLNLSRHRRRMLENRGVMPIDLADHPLAREWPEDQWHQYAVEWLLYTLESGKPYDETMWPSPPQEDQRTIHQLLEPVERIAAPVPRSDPYPENDTSSPYYKNEPLERVKAVLEIWAHNRRLYPGWLIFPSGEERSELSRHTKEWEPLILNVFPDMSPVERLDALRELSWRREVLLEQITIEFESASESVLQLIDCESRTVENVKVERDDWNQIRDAWRSVALSLLTDARLEMDEALFRRRLESLGLVSEDIPDVEHRIRQEQCLWSLFHLDLETLNSQLDNWVVKHCDPVWMLRKAALLTEIGRHTESDPLIQEALNLIRVQFASGRSIAGLSLEGWALASKLTMNNRQEIDRRWDELASLKCHAGMEMDRLQRTVIGTEQRRKPPPFDLNSTRGHSFSWSNEWQRRIIASYRAVRMSEVAGVPPVNINSGDVPIPTAAASRVLRLAADELAVSNPLLAVSLVLRLCRYEGDELLQRVLSRRRIAGLPDESAATLVRICISLVEYTLAHVTGGSSRREEFHWLERARVTVEVLSRLVSRVTPEQAAQIFEIGTACYQRPAVTQQPLLGAPLTRLLKRSWDALSQELQERHALDVLTLPIAGLNGFFADTEFAEPVLLVDIDDRLPGRTADNDEQFKRIIGLLMDGLRHNGDARKLATLRLIPLIARGCLTDEESSAFAQALWGDSDPILGNQQSSRAPSDWVYLILPVLDPEQAEASFRRKWLAPNADSTIEPIASSVEMLTQVGAAIGGLKAHNRSLVLSTEETEHVLAGVIEITEMLTSGSISWGSDSDSVFRPIRRILTAVVVPNEAAKYLFGKAELLLGTTNDRGNTWLVPIHEIKLALGYSLIPGLLTSMPERADDLKSWLRKGLTSDDDLRIGRAAATLRFLISESQSLPDVPLDDLIRELGTIVASRRRLALPDALLCATHVFDGKGQTYDRPFSRSILEGLGYLAEELRYDLEHEIDDEVPKLKLRCVQLAIAMARNGFRDDPTIAKWLEIGQTDPFPEIRNLVTRCD